MVSIYQNNPQAFDGNINVLRSGSTLRIPDASQISAVSASEASAEVARQYDAWRNGTSAAGTAAASDAGRLRLVTPEQGTTAPSTSTSTAPAAAKPGSTTSSGCVGRPRNARQAARGRTCRSQAPARSAQRRTRHAAGRCPRARRWHGRARRRAGRAGCNGCRSRARSRCSRRTGAAGQAEEAEKDVVEAPQPSLLERVTDYWWVLLGLLAAGLGFVLFQRMRRERGSAEDSLEEALGSRDMRGSTPKFTPRSRDTDILVEERGGRAARPLQRLRRRRAHRSRPARSSRSRTRCRVTARRAWNRAIRWPRPTSTWRTACTTRRPTSCSSR